MQKKEYPKVMVLRKGLVGAVVCIAALIGCLIVHNFYRALQTPQTTADHSSHNVQQVATTADSEWFESGHVEKAPENKPPVLASPAQKGEGRDTSSVATDTQPSVWMADAQADLREAMRAPISSNQLLAGPSAEPSGVNTINATESVETAAASATETDATSSNKSTLQTAGENASTVLPAALHSAIGAYTLQAGTVIPGILLTGVNADLPKYVIGQVRSPVYDSLTGRHVLIPQGAKLMGIYDSQVAYGQERLFVVWERILFPSGQSLTLKGMPGVDVSGYAGFKDQVNRHYGSLVKGALLTSLFSMGSSHRAQQTGANLGASWSAAYQQSLASTALDTGHRFAEEQGAVQPTLEIRPGYLFNILVTQDIVFSGPYAENHHV